MVCECDMTWIRGKQVYGDACILMAWKNADCTVIDAGCGTFPYLHELKRHLFFHGIQCHTIGIDIQACDIEADVVMEMDVRDVKMTGIADVVTSSYFFTMLYDKIIFRDAVISCADMLRDDGVMIVNILKRKTLKTALKLTRPETGVKIMTKEDALKHAEHCCGIVFEKCEHGLAISDDITPDDVRDYMPCLPVWPRVLEHS